MFFFNLSIFDLYFPACVFNLKASEQSKVLNWVAFVWIPNYDASDALAPDRPAEGLEGLKYTTRSMRTSVCP